MGFSYDTFDGDFDFVPVRAHVEFGAVPAFPTEADFHHAVSIAFGREDVAADWRVEASRWRRSNPGVELDLRAVARATAKRLYTKLTGEVTQ